MWNYEKRLQYPVNITKTNPKIAQVIISQFGGPDGELAASMRYLSQKYTAPTRKIAGILNDIGTEESVPGQNTGHLINYSIYLWTYITIMAKNSLTVGRSSK
ncbi:MAG: manganese catalase family protein [Lachnospiraceae bacterium]|nr:manganese catalase family protein [Lachnospiraceae bacterium]